MVMNWDGRPVSWLGGEAEAEFQLDAAGIQAISAPVVRGHSWSHLERCTLHSGHDVDHRSGTQHQQLIHSERSDHHVRVSIQVHVHAGRQRVAKRPQWLDGGRQLSGVNPLGRFRAKSFRTSVEYVHSSLTLIRSSHRKICHAIEQFDSQCCFNS